MKTQIKNKLIEFRSVDNAKKEGYSSIGQPKIIEIDAVPFHNPGLSILLDDLHKDPQFLDELERQREVDAEAYLIEQFKPDRTSERKFTVITIQYYKKAK